MKVLGLKHNKLRGTLRGIERGLDIIVIGSI